MFITVFQCYPSNWFSVAFRRLCQFNASSGVTFFRYITLSTSFPHFISCLPQLFLTSVDQFNIRLGHILHFPYEIHIDNTSTCYFPFFPELFLLFQFSLITFLTFNIFDVLSGQKKV